jgi:hypothetical protein
MGLDLERAIQKRPTQASEDGAAVLDDVATFIRKYVVLGEVQTSAVALWIAHAHAIRSFYTTGRLFVRSPEPECGKSLLFDVMETLVPEDPIIDISISPPALYRSLNDDTPPTVMLDEIDKTIGRSGASDSEALSLLLAVINGGYRRGRYVRRCTGRDHEAVKYPTFAPVAFAGISPKLDRALLTRSIPIDMQRRSPDEHVAEFVAWDAVPEGNAIRDRLSSWASSQKEPLRGCRPERPDAIMNRLAECWVPLLAVAAVAGGEWPDRARAAAIALSGIGREVTEASPNSRLLEALREAFGDRDTVWTSDLLSALNTDEEAPWSRWNDGKGISALDLAKRLAPFKIHRSADIKIDGVNKKGYRREWFEEAWRRYCSSPGTEPDDESISARPPDPLPRYSPTGASGSGQSDPLPDIDPLPLQPLDHKESSGVAGSGSVGTETAAAPLSCEMCGADPAASTVFGRLCDPCGDMVAHGRDLPPPSSGWTDEIEEEVVS